MFSGNPFLSIEWILTIILFISNSAFSAGKRMKVEPLKKISQISQGGEAQTGQSTDGKKRKRGIIPPYIGNEIPFIEEEESPDNKKPPSISSIANINLPPDNTPPIGNISQSVRRGSTEATSSDARPVSNHSNGEPTSKALSASNEVTEKPAKLVTPDISHTSGPTESPNSILTELLPMDKLIRLELRNKETQSTFRQFTQLIENKDIEGYRELLDRLLTEGTPLQVLIIFHILKIKGNTLLHWLSVAHSKELDQELKHILEAFGAYSEQPEESFSRPLWEIRKEITLRKLNRNSLWQLESVVDLDDFEPAVLLKNGQIQNYDRALKRELITPGNTRLFLAVAMGNTNTREGLFDLLKRINKDLPFNEKFIKETKLFATLLTPSLYIKNQQGLTPLQLAIQTAKTQKDGTVAILSRAETIVGIDTSVDSSINNKRKLLWKRVGIGIAVTAIGAAATCAYMFY